MKSTWHEEEDDEEEEEKEEEKKEGDRGRSRSRYVLTSKVGWRTAGVTVSDMPL